MSDLQEVQVNKKQSSGLGVAALVLGIIGFVFAFIPFANYGTGIIPFIGIILGIVAVVSKKAKGVGVAGLIVSSLAFVLTIVMAIVYTAGFATAVNEVVKEANQPVSVVYDVTGTSSDATVTYSTYSNGQSGTEQATSQTLPFTKTVTGTKGWSSYTLTATNGINDEGDISCQITVDGTVVSNQTSTGKLATVTCSSTGAN